MKQFFTNDKTLYYTTTCKSRSEIFDTLDAIVEQYSNVLPESKTGLILIKPNLHMDLNSLMGNTTDLRIISDLIRSLQNRGYKNLVIGEGTNCGMHRFNIDVYSRLGIRDLAKFYGVRFVDFNNTSHVDLTLSAKTTARVAKICLENDCFINLPKIKTHRLAALSVCLKSLVGCFFRMDKRKIHLHLHRQIIQMNEIIKPDLHIVDGLIAKEGQGPAWGEPKRYDTVVAGTNPFFIDSFCAWMTGFSFNEIKYLQIAVDKKHLDPEDLNYIKENICPRPLKKAKKQHFVNLLALPFLDPLRNLTRPLLDHKVITKVLYFTKIREDYYNNTDPAIKNIVVDHSVCDGCGLCNEVCPVNIDITDKFFSVEDKGCIKCLYCYMVCPQKCIQIDGDLGYLSRPIEDYQKHIDKLYS
jgi:uncharacterized protein (DUF362 family)/ferredoxin